MRDIVILHENEEWLKPLYEAFEERGVTPKSWFLDEGVVPFHNQPDDAVYYNRMSVVTYAGTSLRAGTDEAGVNLVREPESYRREWLASVSARGV